MRKGLSKKMCVFLKTERNDRLWITHFKIGIIPGYSKSQKINFLTYENIRYKISVTLFILKTYISIIIIVKIQKLANLCKTLFKLRYKHFYL